MSSRKTEPEQEPTGPRGGKSTSYRTASGETLLRKTAYFSSEEWKALRLAAVEADTTNTEIIRRAVREYLKLVFPEQARSGAIRRLFFVTFTFLDRNRF